MKTTRHNIIALFAFFTFLPIFHLNAAEMICIDFLRTIASRDTLMIQIGKKGQNCAFKITFGHGLAARSVGLVYEETLSQENTSKLNAAVEKLLDILNNPDTNSLGLTDITQKIGLTLKEVTRAETIE